MKLTSNERIMRIFRKEEIDRPALKLWGAGFPTNKQLHPNYQPISDLAYELTDLFLNVKSPFNLYMGTYASDYVESFNEPTEDPKWFKEHLILHTPKGDLERIKIRSTIGDPGYILEYLIKEPEDIDKFLSLPYQPFPIDTKPYEEAKRKLGDRGVVMVSCSHAGYAMQDMIGSENLAYFSIDCREKLVELCSIFSDRIYDHTKAMLEAGMVTPYSWVGPEVLIPPLMSPADFKEFCYKPDKRICDLIHEHGSHVWVHCHGKVANFIDDFISMGVDVLNPLEPPKNGDISMRKLVDQYGNRLGLEGNIEIQELLQSDHTRLRELIDACVDAGKDSGRFILCPSAGYMEYTRPTPQYIENLKFYLTYGYEAVERCRK